MYKISLKFKSFVRNRLGFRVKNIEKAYLHPSDFVNLLLKR